MTSPLPPIKDDPAIVAGFASKAKFADQATAIRSNANWEASDHLKAAKIAGLWQETIAELNRLQTDFADRRSARWDALQAQIPNGPGLAPDTSPADRAVLNSAFQQHVDRARAATTEDLSKMYTDAMRFGDELAQRAVFVVAQEGRGMILKQYKADHPEVSAVLDELDTMMNPPGRGFIGQAFGVGRTFPEPPEIKALAEFEQQGNQPAQPSRIGA